MNENERIAPFTVVVEDIDCKNGDCVERKVSDWSKVEKLVAAIDFMSGDTKVVTVYNAKGEWLDC